MVVLAHLQRRWSLRGREGFGILSPSFLASSVGFSVFVEMKHLFFIALEASFREVIDVFLTKKHSLDAGYGSIRCWACV
jgi:hypothetical protein